MRRRLENKWRKSRLDTDKNKYLEQKQAVQDLICGAKREYFHDKLFSADSKQQFRTLNTLLNNTAKLLPSFDSLSDLADKFADFFVDKIHKIRRNLDLDSGLDGSPVTGVTNQGGIDSCVSNDLNVIGNIHIMSDGVKGEEFVESDATELHDLKPVSIEEIDRILKKCSNKSCLLDPIPTWLLKDNSTHFIPVLAEIVNVSFATGNFPDALTEAIITPIIKKQTMDPDILKNFRPVSNIKVVA